MQTPLVASKRLWLLPRKAKRTYLSSCIDNDAFVNEDGEQTQDKAYFVEPAVTLMVEKQAKEAFPSDIVKQQDYIKTMSLVILVSNDAERRRGGSTVLVTDHVTVLATKSGRYCIGHLGAKNRKLLVEQKNNMHFPNQ
eukprot:Platyproteum_vivax@DN6202_c0_g1_i1.p1